MLSDVHLRTAGQDHLLAFSTPDAAHGRHDFWDTDLQVDLISEH